MSGQHGSAWDEGRDDHADWDDNTDWDGEAPPYWAAGQHLPGDARRMGLSQHVPDGALLDFAGSLDSTKLLHRVTAWVMLFVFGMPVALHAARLVLAVLPG